MNQGTIYVHCLSNSVPVHVFLVGAGAGTSGGVLSQCSRIHQGEREPAQNIAHERWRERGVGDGIRVDLPQAFCLSHFLCLTQICGPAGQYLCLQTFECQHGRQKSQQGVPKLKRRTRVEIVLMDPDFSRKSFVQGQMW